MRIKPIVKLFRKNNVIVYGVKGSGKDMLTANVIVRRALPYVSNVDYGGQHYPLYLPLLDVSGNDYRDFIGNSLSRYEYPYPDGTDIYISDAGVYFPSQYCSQLNNQYPYYATLQALIRHLGDAAVHCNAQALNRVWDKIREQADAYVLCRWCIVLFRGRLVIQSVTQYDRYDSAIAKVEPCRVHGGLFGTARALVRIERQRFKQQYGYVRRRLLIYKNRSKYDTRAFRTILGGENYAQILKKGKASGRGFRPRLASLFHRFAAFFKRR